MAKRGTKRIFDTDRRIRVGIWGLGRGTDFFSTCRFLNIDVVAGCDYNRHMWTNLLEFNPGAFVTADAEEFLKQDFDAVILATFCPAHADDAIRCLRAGKHVLSEVTAFFTLAEGVRLVEEVEKRELVYNLAENYPFTAANMWLANRWREGLFGDLMYAEYEYVHECRALSYTYIDGVPVTPGHTVHNWRSWLNFHYYCTHSLGPVMVITGTRPTAVEAFPVSRQIAGFLSRQGEGNGTMTPSLIRMSNGGVVRNLMGASTNDTHQQRVWGTQGAFEIGHDGVQLRLGGTGQSPRFPVKPQWEGLGELAAKTGHEGGDFWTLYYFAREILTGEKGPFDIYGACDVTIPGIQALRSSLAGGTPHPVPDFRLQCERDTYRTDDWQMARYDVQRGVFGGANLNGKAATFTTTMKAMVLQAPVYRAYADWKKVRPALVHERDFLTVARNVLVNYAPLAAAYRDARAIVDAYPQSDGARVLAEMLELGQETEVLAPGFLARLKRECARLECECGSGMHELSEVKASRLLPWQRIAAAEYPAKTVKFFETLAVADHGYINIQATHQQDTGGMVYIKGVVAAEKAVIGFLRYGADGPVKVFVNGQTVDCKPRAANPILPPKFKVRVSWKAGKNEVVFALDLNKGNAWGVAANAMFLSGDV